MNLKQISNKALKILRLLFWFGLALIAVGMLLFISAYGSGATFIRLYIIPALIILPGLCFSVPPGIILLKIWLIKKQINDIKEKGEKVIKVADVAGTIYTKYTDNNKAP